MKSPRRVRRTRPADSVEPRFSRGTLAAIREADQLADDLQSGAVTREELVRTGRAFATVDDWLKAMA